MSNSNLTAYASVEVTSFSFSSLLSKEDQDATGGLFKNKTVMDLIVKYLKTYTGKSLIASNIKDVQVFKEDELYIGICDYKKIKDFVNPLNSLDKNVSIPEVETFLKESCML